MKKIQSFWLRLNEFKAADSDSARRGRLLNILLAGMFVLSVFALIATVIILSALSTWDKPDNRLLLITIVVFIVGSSGLFIINQRNQKLAALLFLLLLNVIGFIFSDLPSELANGRSTYVFLIPIAISSLLLTPASSFFFAIGNTITVIALAD